MNDVDSPTLVDRFEQVRITAQSPDRSLTATWTAKEGLRTTLSAEAVAEHTEESLAAQVTAAVRGAQKGYVLAMSKLFDSGSSPDKAFDDEDLRGRCEREVAAIEAHGVSKRGLAKADAVGDGLVSVRLKPGVLRSMVSAEVLMTEINAAIEEAMRLYRPQWLEVKARYRAEQLRLTRGTR